MIFASRDANKAAKKSKHNYDLKVRESLLEPGDRVSVRKVDIQGKQKLANKWEYCIYIMKGHQHPNVPVYVVKRGDIVVGRKRTLHRTLLLYLGSVPSRIFPILDQKGTKQYLMVRKSSVHHF